MNKKLLLGFGVAIGCFGFATPASAQSFGIGQLVSAMARDGILGTDLANLIRERQLQRFQQVPQELPRGKAWGLRGGKPYTGQGNPLNGLPKGRAFRQLPDGSNGFRGFGRGRNRGFGRGRGRR